MATQGRDDHGRFSAKMRDQDLLKAFDFEATDEDPYLTAAEVTDALARHWEIDVTAEAVRERLETMREREFVDRREFGSAVAYRALVAPEPSEGAEMVSAERRTTDRDEFVALDDA